MDTRSRLGHWVNARLLAALTCPFLFQGMVVSAHETDNFYLPLDCELADTGQFLETVHTVALENAVATANASIERALTITDSVSREKSLATWHSAEALAQAFMDQFSAATVETEAAM